MSLIKLPKLLPYAYKWLVCICRVIISTFLLTPSDYISDNFDVPRIRTVFRTKSFNASGPLLWTDLPPHIKDADSLNSFKRSLKTYFSTNPSNDDIQPICMNFRNSKRFPVTHFGSLYFSVRRPCFRLLDFAAPFK